MELARQGSNFPTIWMTVLKDHPLVGGIPESRHEDARPVLAICLTTGETLVFNGDSKNFRLK
jgi:hypothetical protein